MDFVWTRLQCTHSHMVVNERSFFQRKTYLDKCNEMTLNIEYIFIDDAANSMKLMKPIAFVSLSARWHSILHYFHFVCVFWKSNKSIELNPIPLQKLLTLRRRAFKPFEMEGWDVSVLLMCQAWRGFTSLDSGPKNCFILQALCTRLTMKISGSRQGLLWQKQCWNFMHPSCAFHDKFPMETASCCNIVF